jgi:hypothetical protein
MSLFLFKALETVEMFTPAFKAISFSVATVALPFIEKDIKYHGAGDRRPPPLPFPYFSMASLYVSTFPFVMRTVPESE